MVPNPWCNTKSVHFLRTPNKIPTGYHVDWFLVYHLLVVSLKRYSGYYYFSLMSFCGSWSFSRQMLVLFYLHLFNFVLFIPVKCHFSKTSRKKNHFVYSSHSDSSHSDSGSAIRIGTWPSFANHTNFTSVGIKISSGLRMSSKVHYVVLSRDH